MRQKIATIFGASGFIGRHLIRRLTQKNYRIIAVTRSPYLHGYLKLLGNIGQIDLEKVNIFDEEKIRPIIESSDIVINLVGILFENKIQKFENIHAQFPYLIAKLCKEYNVEKLVHLSALGANINSNSNYMKSKARGEKYILDNIKNSVILRPSVIFGPEDNFFNQFASLTQFLPFLPLIGGGKNKFQPIYVLDVVKSIITVLEKEKDESAIFAMAGSGFASTVRLAKSSPQTWSSIFEENKENVLETLKHYLTNLESFKSLLENDEYKKIYHTIEKTNAIKSVLKGIKK